MSVIDSPVSEVQAARDVPIKEPSSERHLHRLAEVRRRQEITRRTLARRLNTNVATVKQQDSLPPTWRFRSSTPGRRS